MSMIFHLQVNSIIKDENRFENLISNQVSFLQLILMCFLPSSLSVYRKKMKVTQVKKFIFFIMVITEITIILIPLKKIRDFT